VIKTTEGPFSFPETNWHNMLGVPAAITLLSPPKDALKGLYQTLNCTHIVWESASWPKATTFLRLNSMDKPALAQINLQSQ